MQPLTGQGKPFHSALDKAAALLKRKVGTGQEFMKELQGLGGIKQAEMDERKLAALLGMPKMTHEQFMKELASRPMPAIHEKVFGEKINEDFVKELAQEYAYEAALDSLHEDGVRGNLASDLAKDMAKENYREYWDEAMREVGKGSGATYHEQYTIPGGENYREMLIKAPEGSDQFAGLRYHYNGEPGILASMRLKDRLVPDLEGEHNVKIIGGGGTSNKKFKTRAEAEAFANVKHQGGYRTELTPTQTKKLLHLEELQSDWHQQGRDHGYKSEFEPEEELINKRNDLYDARTEIVRKALEIEKKEGLIPLEMQEQINSINDQLRAVEERKDKSRFAIPDAPFKKNWEEMALKRLIHHAAENGYHGIVVTPGAEQADRYSLAKHIDSIMLLPNPYPNKDTHPYYFKAFDKEGNKVADDNVNEEKLQEYIGKEPAQQLLSAQPNHMGERMISGANIVTGDKGMKGFYDKKVPNILNSIGKKYGVKTQLHGHKLKTGKDLNFPEEISRRNNLPSFVPGEEHQVHHFPITEEMRKDILTNGLPMYDHGGEVDAEEVFMGKGGKVKEPKNTTKAYKLFRVNEKHPGKLFPLFVNANQPVEMGKWVDAEVGPQTETGKVKSKLGPLAYRPGWHSGDLPVATHIGGGGAPPTHRPKNHVWAEVEVPNDVDWQTEADKRGMNKAGKLIARNAHITDQIPTGGHYRYKTNPNMTGNWLISGSMKVNKVLSHPEVERINKKAGVADLPRIEPFNKKEFGFEKGGEVDAESYFFPNKE